MATDINTIKDNILKLIKDEDYNVEDLTNILNSVSDYLSNPDFITNINQIINILTIDRDNSRSFTIDDVTLLSKDPLALMSLVTIAVSTICSIPALKIKYDENMSEVLVFELLAYIFLVVLPKEAKIKWSHDDKVQIVNIAMVVVQQIRSSDMLKQVFADVMSWFKNNVKCNCTKNNQATNRDIMNNKLNHHRLIIRYSIESNRETNLLRQELNKLKKRTRDLKVKQ